MRKINISNVHDFEQNHISRERKNGVKRGAAQLSSRVRLGRRPMTSIAHARATRTPRAKLADDASTAPLLFIEVSRSCARY